MLQHNWAIVLESEGYARILFYGDTCGIFDEIAVSLTGDAVDALVRKGFAKFREDARILVAARRFCCGEEHLMTKID
jgi:hypothetical protein